jgi:hypothetical protein
MPDPVSLFLSIIFGAVGVIAIKRAKTEGNIACTFLGIALFIFPYFLSWWVWVLLVGVGLSAGVWYFWEEE